MSKPFEIVCSLFLFCIILLAVYGLTIERGITVESEYELFIEARSKGLSYMDALRYKRPVPLQREPEPLPVVPIEVQKYRNELLKYDWNVEIMGKIMLCESGGNTYAENKTRWEHSVGVMQINRFAHPTYTVEQLKDPAINIKEAYRIYKQQGYWAWKLCSIKLGLI